MQRPGCCSAADKGGNPKQVGVGGGAGEQVGVKGFSLLPSNDKQRCPAARTGRELMGSLGPVGMLSTGQPWGCSPLGAASACQPAPSASLTFVCKFGGHRLILRY